MRIIAGTLRGRALLAPEGTATRPTADRVRETLLSMLVSRLGSFDGLRVADLFAGSGALGLEAMSRGAARACFVENDRRAIDAIRRNVAALGLEDRSQILACSALALPPAEGFDLLFADPPYAPGSGSAAAAEAVRAGWVAGGGWLAVETARGEPVQAPSLALEAQRDVGQARISLLWRTSPSTLS